MSIQGPKIIFGGGGFDPAYGYDAQKVEEILDLLESEGVKVIDTATIYGASEELLGTTNAPSRFTIDTKFPGGLAPNPTTKEAIVQTGKDSLRKLKTDQVNVYYLHSPDPRVPLEDVLAGIQELYSIGAFKQFGLSNFSAQEVEDVVRIAKEKNYVLPSVYQGNYNAFARKSETVLLPTLRKHNIAYYAYSPIAGGFLAKTSEELKKGGQGRWDANSPLGKMYLSLYGTEKGFQGLDAWNDLAKEKGIPKVELAYRWVVHNSALKAELGDGVVIGGRDVKQITETLHGIKKGPLSKDVADRIEEIWKLIESSAPLDNWSDYVALGKLQLP